MPQELRSRPDLASIDNTAPNPDAAVSSDVAVVPDTTVSPSEPADDASVPKTTLDSDATAASNSGGDLAKNQCVHDSEPADATLHPATTAATNSGGEQAQPQSVHGGNAFFMFLLFSFIRKLTTCLPNYSHFALSKSESRPGINFFP